LDGVLRWAVWRRGRFTVSDIGKPPYFEFGGVKKNGDISRV